jgi:hypothetical protein
MARDRLFVRVILGGTDAETFPDDGDNDTGHPGLAVFPTVLADHLKRLASRVDLARESAETGGDVVDRLGRQSRDSTYRQRLVRGRRARGIAANERSDELFLDRSHQRHDDSSDDRVQLVHDGSQRLADEAGISRRLERYLEHFASLPGGVADREHIGLDLVQQRGRDRSRVQVDREREIGVGDSGQKEVFKSRGVDGE